MEHTVTEEVTGLDLVALALRLADGVPLAKAGLSTAGLAEGPPSRGFAVQARLNAETVTRDGSVAGGHRPPGPLPAAERPGRAGRHARLPRATRSARATTRCSPRSSPPAPPWTRRSPGCAAPSASSTCTACPVNRDLLLAVVADPALREGRIDTGYLDAHLSGLAGGARPRRPAGHSPARGRARSSRCAPRCLASSWRCWSKRATRSPPGPRCIVFEAMKMHHVVVADRPCVIREVTVAVGDLVEAGQPVAYAEPSGAGGGGGRRRGERRPGPHPRRPARDHRQAPLHPRRGAPAGRPPAGTTRAGAPHGRTSPTWSTRGRSSSTARWPSPRSGRPARCRT